jgi:hypothetical protein
VLDRAHIVDMSMQTRRPAAEYRFRPLQRNAFPKIS